MTPDEHCGLLRRRPATDSYISGLNLDGTSNIYENDSILPHLFCFTFLMFIYGPEKLRVVLIRTINDWRCQSKHRTNTDMGPSRVMGYSRIISGNLRMSCGILR